MQLVLASASPARLHTLQAAGLAPIVHVSGVDESKVHAPDAEGLATELARLKGEAVLAERGTSTDAAIIACDSVLAMDGRVHGKPRTDERVRERWRAMRGRTGELITGHHLAVVRDGQVVRDTRVGTTTVSFADVTDEEIEAYVASGEPHQCAGAFTLDGFGGAFVEGVGGDPHNVIGLSLPLFRHMLVDLGVAWTTLWRPGQSLDAP